MADQKLSQLTAATTPLTGTETLYAVQSAASRKTTAQAVANLAPGTDLSFTAGTRTLASSTGTDVVLPLATTTDAGLQSAADKTRIDELGATDSPSFAGLTITGTDAVTIPHIHGELAGPVYIHVKNTGAATLAKGTPVYVTGAVGDTSTLEVQAADSSDPAKMPAIGLLGSSLAQNASGHAIVAGELLNAATGSYGVGDALFVAAGGGLTATEPTTGTIQQVAIVGRVNADTGSLTATIGSLQDPNWDTAYSQRLRWDGGATGLDAATGRTSLGLGTAATTAATDYATATHIHGNISNGGAIGSTSGLPIITGTSGVLQAGSFGTTSGTFAQGNDARFQKEIGLACSDETTALTTGTAKVTFRMPYAMTLQAVRASVTTAPTGSTLVVDVNEGGTSVLSTKLSIDASEKTSTTAATAAVISDSSLADDAEITIDIDQIGATIAGAGLKVWLIGVRA
jgi:hypothetical protein